MIEDAALNCSRTDPGAFAKNLSESMAAWRGAGIRAVWLRVATEASRLVPVAIEQGFLPHHAAPDHVRTFSPRRCRMQATRVRCGTDGGCV